MNRFFDINRDLAPLRRSLFLFYWSQFVFCWLGWVFDRALYRLMHRARPRGGAHLFLAFDPSTFVHSFEYRWACRREELRRWLLNVEPDPRDQESRVTYDRYKSCVEQHFEREE